MSVDQSSFLTDDGVDATTLIGNTVYHNLNGITPFEVRGIDIVLNDDGNVEARVYGEDHNPWIECSSVRYRPGSWATDAIREKAEKLAAWARNLGVELTYELSDGVSVDA